jgi:hypothetical protein
MLGSSPGKVCLCLFVSFFPRPACDWTWAPRSPELLSPTRWPYRLCNAPPETDRDYLSSLPHAVNISNTRASPIMHSHVPGPGPGLAGRYMPWSSPDPVRACPGEYIHTWAMLGQCMINDLSVTTCLSLA